MTVKRVPLHEHLPLHTPFSLHIFPIYKCNFSCKYCLHSLSNAQLAEKKFNKDVMTMETFTKAIDDLAAFASPLKALIFAGHGEPLLHPKLPAMVAYANKSNCAQRIEITTNASLLSKKMADELINAGVDRLKISIQGTSSQKYQEICDYNINYPKFLENLHYFYTHKKHTEVYIKIIDIALDGQNDKEKFTAMFSPLADVIDVEYAIPFIKELDSTVYDKEFTCCKQGHSARSRICSMPFYMQVITPTGDVLPCCSSDVPIILGNVHQTTLKDIWEGSKNRTFLRLQLHDKDKNPICQSCSVPSFGLQDGDYLDAHSEKLLTIYEKTK